MVLAVVDERRVHVMQALLHGGKGILGRHVFRAILAMGLVHVEAASSNLVVVVEVTEPPGNGEPTSLSCMQSLILYLCFINLLFSHYSDLF